MGSRGSNAPSPTTLAMYLPRLGFLLISICPPAALESKARLRKQEEGRSGDGNGKEGEEGVQKSQDLGRNVERVSK